MRLPSSVISLIESHLPPPHALGKAGHGPGPGPAVTALAPPALALRPTQPSRASPAIQTKPNPRTGKQLTVKGALRRFPHIPSIALGAAHRLLNDHAAEPGPSTSTSHAGVSYLLRRQRLYERLIRTFAGYQSSERATAFSLWQRMKEERCPPTLDTLKHLLSVAGKSGVPVLPIVQSVLQDFTSAPGLAPGLPEQTDVHLLVLIMKGLVREAGIKPDALEQLIHDCLPEEIEARGENRPVVMDELLVEAYGQAGDMKGIINTLSRSRAQHPPTPQSETDRQAILSLYLQALRQWSSNPVLRRKRRGAASASLFPRILTKDVLDLCGGTAGELPLEWLNGWMNAERITGDSKAALAVWHLIQQSDPDAQSYTTHFKLAKQSTPTLELDFDLRATTQSALQVSNVSVEMLQEGLAAAMHLHDLPLALHLARQLSAEQGDGSDKVWVPTERTVDLFASGLIRLHRRHRRSNKKRNVPEYILADEWDSLSARLAIQGVEVALPLSRPIARLVKHKHGEGGREEYVATFSPAVGDREGSTAKAIRLRAILRCLTSLLEKAVAPNPAALEGMMADLHRSLCP